MVQVEAGKAGETDATAQGGVVSGSVPGELDIKKALELGVEDQRPEIFSLKGIEMKIPKGQLVAVVGAVG